MYTPEWERADSPTATMKHGEMIAYYKAHAVAGDCRFVLSTGNAMPTAIHDGFVALFEQVIAARKETRAHRVERDRLRSLLRVHRAAEAIVTLVRRAA